MLHIHSIGWPYICMDWILTLNDREGPVYQRVVIWAPLPPTWTGTEFTSHIQRQWLAIVTAETFGVEETQQHAIPISLGPASSHAELVRALEVVAIALKSSAARTRVV
jgi:hypothetical protein